ncbi:MAG: SlyX family protein [Pseudomonadota bacterium]
MEERLVELETRVAFQENTLQELNDVVVRQQQEIDQLKSDLETIRVQVLALTPASLEENPA